MECAPGGCEVGPIPLSSNRVAFNYMKQIWKPLPPEGFGVMLITPGEFLERFVADYQRNGVTIQRCVLTVSRDTRAPEMTRAWQVTEMSCSPKKAA